MCRSRMWAFNLTHNADAHTIYTNFKDLFNNLDSTVRIDQQFGQKLNNLLSLPARYVP